LVIQKEELSKIKFCHSNLLRKEIEMTPNNFVPHGNYWVDIINEVEKLIK